MHPVLFTFPLGRREIALHSYGLLIAAGLAVGIWLAHREGGRRGFDQGRVLDLAFWLVVSGLVGSRLTYGLVNARSFFHACVDGDGPWWRDCTSLLAVWEGGLVFYGGVAAAALVALVFARREGWSFGERRRSLRAGARDRPRLRPPRLLRRRLLLRQGDRLAARRRLPARQRRLRGPAARGRRPARRRRDAAAAPDAALRGGRRAGAVRPALRCSARACAGGRARSCSATSASTRSSASWSRSFAATSCAGSRSRSRRRGWRGWLGLPPAEPIFFSAGQIGSLLTVAAVAAALIWRHRAPRTPAP